MYYKHQVECHLLKSICGFYLFSSVVDTWKLRGLSVSLACMCKARNFQVVDREDKEFDRSGDHIIAEEQSVETGQTFQVDFYWDGQPLTCT